MTRHPRKGLPGSRWLPVVLVSLIATGGCSVVEVIDNIGNDPQAKTEAPEPEAEGNLPTVPDGSAQAKLRAYYNRKGRKVEQDPNNPIVNCRVAGSTQFMRKYDCEIRGGHEV